MKLLYMLLPLLLAGCSVMEVMTPQGTHYKSTRFMMKSGVKELLYDADTHELLLYGYTSNPMELAIQAYNMGIKMGSGSK